MLDPIKLPSGAELKITVAQFGISKNLYQAILEEMKNLKIDAKTEIDANLFKDIFCVSLSSKKIERALEECMKKCLYKGMKIDADTFEPVDAREDYLQVCLEIGKANVMPFFRQASALLSQASAMIPGVQK
jgi:hypothetical protein